MKLNREELLKFAKLTALKLSDAECDALLADIQNLLSYADELAHVELGTESKTLTNTNVFREDTVVACSADSPLHNAPEQDGSYFVVPKIIDDSKDAA